MWPEVEHEALLPPPLRRLPGRPRKNRRKEVDEDVHGSISRRSSTVRCSNCKSFGHNCKTCQRAPVKAKSKRGGRGRSHRGKGVAGGDKAEGMTQEECLTQEVQGGSVNGAGGSGRGCKRGRGRSSSRGGKGRGLGRGGRGRESDQGMHQEGSLTQEWNGSASGTGLSEAGPSGEGPSGVGK